MHRLSNVPAMLTKIPNWVAWREEQRGDGKVTKVPYQATNSLLRASSTNPATWNLFSAAVKKALHISDVGIKTGAGFVLEPSYGLVCIDLDDPHKLGPNAANAAKVHQEILDAFDGTYREISPSGTGYHVWLFGRLPDNRLSLSLKDKVGIEIYCGARYMTMTGHQYGMSDDITDMQPMLDKLIALMTNINGGTMPGAAIGAGELEESQDLGRRSDLTDDQVLQIAIRANSKFLEFYNSTPSSDRSRFARPVAGDLDKISALPEQILRIMLASPIGKCYLADELERKLLNYWIPESRVSNEVILRRREEGRQMQVRMAEAEMERQRIADEAAANGTPVESATVDAATPFRTPFKNAPEYVEKYATDYPPGMIGIMAREIRERATMRASKDFAIAAALSLFSGLSGHAYSCERVNGALYMLLLGTSGQGKEAPAEARDTLVNQLRNVNVPPSILGGLHGPSKITSPQGLHRRLEENKTLLCIMGESTLWLSDLATAKQNINLEIQRFILDLYGKQGKGRVIEPASIMNKDNKLNTIMSPAATLLMEGEPSRYMELLGNDAYTASGLCARIVHVLGHPDDMPCKNYGHTSFSDHVVNNLASVLPVWWNKLLEQNAYMAASKHGANGGAAGLNNAYIQVLMDDECLHYHRAFDRELDFFTRDNVGRVADIYNRVVPNVLRIATNVAAGIDPFKPLITKEIYGWAQAFVLRGLLHLGLKIDQGAVGTGDARVKDMMLEQMQRWSEMLPQERNEKLRSIGQIRQHDKRAMLSNLKGIPWSILLRMIATRVARHVTAERATPIMRMLLQVLVETGEIRITESVTEGNVRFDGRVIFLADDADAFGE